MSTADKATGSTASNLEALREWFISHGGILHPSLGLSSASADNVRKGASIQISPDTTSITPMTTLIDAPFETTLSALSIPQVAPFWPAAFLDAFADSPQILTRFVLLEAWLQAEKGSWWPYLRALPQPKSKDVADALGSDLKGTEDEHDPVDTPLYWSEEDRTWLHGTRLETATAERDKLWREELEKARRIFREAEILSEHRTAWETVQPCIWDAYTWPLYLWATTLLTSRSFPSKVLAGWQPQWDESSAWGRCEVAKTWRAGSMSRKFPVMFPALDLGNHDPKAKVGWDCNGVSLKLVTHEKLRGGTELNNNYGPKSNDELIIGYGFLIEDNEDDEVTMAVSTRSAVSTSQQSIPMQSDSREAVLSETRGLRRILKDTREVDVSTILRGALSLSQAQTLAMQFANQRELKSFTSPDDVSAFLPESPTRCQALIVDRTIVALREYRVRLLESAPPSQPKTSRQRMAATFRADQIDIIEQNIEQLESFLLGLQRQKLIVTLHQILSDDFVSPEAVRLPLRAIVQDHIGKKPKVRDVVGNGLLEFCFVVWICLISQHAESVAQHENSGSQIDSENLIALGQAWLARWYGDIRQPGGESMDLTSSAPDIFEADITEASSSYRRLMKEYGSRDDQQFAEVFVQLAENSSLIEGGTFVWRQENVAFESMDRIIFNGDSEVHEEFLFLEQSR